MVTASTTGYNYEKAPYKHLSRPDTTPNTHDLESCLKLLVVIWFIQVSCETVIFWVFLGKRDWKSKSTIPLQSWLCPLTSMCEPCTASMQNQYPKYFDVESNYNFVCILIKGLVMSWTVSEKPFRHAERPNAIANGLRQAMRRSRRDSSGASGLSCPSHT